MSKKEAKTILIILKKVKEKHKEKYFRKINERTHFPLTFLSSLKILDNIIVFLKDLDFYFLFFVNVALRYILAHFILAFYTSIYT